MLPNLPATKREINGRRSVCAIYDLNNKAYTENWLRDFRSTFEFMGGSIRQSTTFHSGNDAVFYRQTQALLSSQPDLFLIIANAVDAALICQQVRKMNKQVAIAISEWGATERFVELGGAATDGVFGLPVPGPRRSIGKISRVSEPVFQAFQP